MRLRARTHVHASHNPGDGAMSDDAGMPAVMSNARHANGRYDRQQIVSADSTLREDLVCAATCRWRLACSGVKRSVLKMAKNGSSRPSQAQLSSLRSPGYKDPTPGTIGGASAGTNALRPGGKPNPTGHPQNNGGDSGVPTRGLTGRYAGCRAAHSWLDRRHAGIKGQGSSSHKQAAEERMMPSRTNPPLPSSPVYRGRSPAGHANQRWPLSCGRRSLLWATLRCIKTDLTNAICRTVVVPARRERPGERQAVGIGSSSHQCLYGTGCRLQELVSP